jgi:hypothetical protein
VVEDDLPVEVFEAGHQRAGPVVGWNGPAVALASPWMASGCRSDRPGFVPASHSA